MFYCRTLVIAILFFGVTSTALAKTVTVTIEGLKCKPETVEIEAGDTVVWKNADEREHTVTAEDGSFDSKTIGAGKSWSRKFDKPGKYAYGSDPSPRTKGTVVVKAKK